MESVAIRCIVSNVLYQHLILSVFVVSLWNRKVLTQLPWEFFKTQKWYVNRKIVQLIKRYRLTKSLCLMLNRVLYKHVLVHLNVMIQYQHLMTKMEWFIIKLAKILLYNAAYVRKVLWEKIWVSIEKNAFLQLWLKTWP